MRRFAPISVVVNAVDLAREDTIPPRSRRNCIFQAVRWRTAVLAWALTFPVCLIAGGWLARHFVASTLLAVCAALFGASAAGVLCHVLLTRWAALKREREGGTPELASIPEPDVELVDERSYFL